MINFDRPVVRIAAPMSDVIIVEHLSEKGVVLGYNVMYQFSKSKEADVYRFHMDHVNKNHRAEYETVVKAKAAANRLSKRLNPFIAKNKGIVEHV